MYNQFPYSSFNNAYNIWPKSNSFGFYKKPFNWDSFLNNAQRTLNVINQAMPIYNQVKPMFKNMGTVMRVIGELNSSPNIKLETNNSPRFFA